VKILLDFQDDSELGSCGCGAAQGRHYHLLLTPSRDWVESTELKRQGRTVRSLVKYLTSSGFDVESSEPRCEARRTGAPSSNSRRLIPQSQHQQ
jgi:hypothetical protein